MLFSLQQICIICIVKKEEENNRIYIYPLKRCNSSVIAFADCLPSPLQHCLVFLSAIFRIQSRKKVASFILMGRYFQRSLSLSLSLTLAIFPLERQNFLNCLTGTNKLPSPINYTLIAEFQVDFQSIMNGVTFQ